MEAESAVSTKLMDMSSTGLSRSATQETFRPTRPPFHPVAPVVVTATCSTQCPRNAGFLGLPPLVRSRVLPRAQQGPWAPSPFDVSWDL